ncbi:response regulator transcription factor [Lysobacter enzymogenes]|uniref:DNA-binding response regulator n=1 Tax=Lysobacter enzymogenes TaxID=69 RepID=A0AAU9AMT9_LYSEN|nr:response regulator [Lysobacter enzymogenes]BAW00298.1 DNA-binding response regulator [Lysobacter enzymogenes]
MSEGRSQDVRTGEVRIYLVDDNDGFRDSTAWLLETAGFQVQAYASAPAFLEAYAQERHGGGAQCLVSDIRMPLMSGLQLQEELRRRGIGLPLVFVTAHGDVPLAVEAMRKGAANFLEKPFSDEGLIEAIRAAVANARNHAGGGEGGDDRLAKLSPRERQVMDLVVASKPNKIIADVLGISVKTVELHRSNMMNKLGVRSLPELMKVALGHG